MQPSLHLLFPLSGGVAYVFAMLFFKRSGDLGAGVWRTALLSNLAIALAFAAFWFAGGPGQPAAFLWQPFVVAVLFVGGQVFGFLALHHGDVSVATPVLGLKILFVALGSSFLLPGDIPARIWAASVLGTLAIALLGRGKSRERHNVGLTVTFSALGAASFALFDILVQKWTPAWGAGRFFPIMFGLVAVLSLGFVPFFRAPLRAIPRPARGWLAGGCILLAVQSALFVYAVGAFGDATVMNIVYSVRGLWSVLAVRMIGHWFANDERSLPAPILRGRMFGAGLMLAAVALAVSG